MMMRPVEKSTGFVYFLEENCLKNGSVQNRRDMIEYNRMLYYEAERSP